MGFIELQKNRPVDLPQNYNLHKVRIFTICVLPSQCSIEKLVVPSRHVIIVRPSLAVSITHLFLALKYKFFPFDKNFLLNNFF